MGKNSTLLDSLPSGQVRNDENLHPWTNDIFRDLWHLQCFFQPLHVCLLGLDSAGKTTALYRMKFDQYLNTVPTIGFNCEKIRGTVGRAKGVSFLVWGNLIESSGSREWWGLNSIVDLFLFFSDVGGQEKLRPLWRSYTRCTDGIIFVIDSVDLERMEEAKMELMRTAKCPDNQVNHRHGNRCQAVNNNIVIDDTFPGNPAFNSSQ